VIKSTLYPTKQSGREKPGCQSEEKLKNGSRSTTTPTESSTQELWDDSQSPLQWYRVPQVGREELTAVIAEVMASVTNLVHRLFFF